MPSRDRWSTRAKPRPPDCMTRPVTPARAGPGGERGVQADAGHRHPEAVRADQPHAVPAAHREQVGALRGVQPGGDHHQGPHAALAALFGHVEHLGGGQRDDRQVGRLGQVERRGQAPLAADLPGARVHRVEPAGVPAGPDVVQDGPAHGAAAPARADHRDRLGREYVPQAGGIGAALPLGHHVEVAVAVPLAGQREGQLDDTLRVVPRDGQAGVGEDVQHGRVLGQGLGLERGDLRGSWPARPGARAAGWRCPCGACGRPPRTRPRLWVPAGRGAARSWPRRPARRRRWPAARRCPGRGSGRSAAPPSRPRAGSC